MKRHLPRPPSLKRRVGFLQPKVEIVIACEGTVTEPQYFEDCIEEYGAGLVRLRVIPRSGAPLTVVRAAIEERDGLIEKRNRSPDSFDACFRVWAVFDRDEHPNVPEALQLARDSRIDIAYSNPCFELWPLLHLEDYGSQDGRHAVQARLAALMPGYNHQAGAIVQFHLIKESVAIAIERAKRLRLARESEGVPLGCPSTTVGDLVLKIAQNGKATFAKTKGRGNCA